MKKLITILAFGLFLVSNEIGLCYGSFTKNTKVNEEARSVESDLDHRVIQLFTSTAIKEEPLLSCRAFQSGIKYRIPSVINCDVVDTTEPSHALEISIWVENLSPKAVIGYECYSIMTRAITFSNFFGAKDREISTRKNPVSPLECLKMVQTNHSPEGDELVTVTRGFRSTENEPKSSYTWLVTEDNYATNYFVVELQVHVSDHDDTIHAATKMPDNCKYDVGICYTDLGVLVWSKKQFNHCQLKKTSTTTCVRTGHRVSCLQLTMSFTRIKAEKLCGLNIGLSEQGVLITPVLRNFSYLAEIATTHEVEDRILKLVTERELNKLRPRRSLVDKTNLPNPTRKRVNKNDSLLASKIEGSTNKLSHKASFDTSAVKNANLEFVFNIIKDGNAYIVQMFHNEMCQLCNRELLVIRQFAVGGHPTLLVRYITHSNDYVGRLEGDVVSIFKCRKIFQYKFLPRTTCIQEFPVTYVLDNDGVFSNGFVVGLSHEIIERSTPALNCPPGEYYFEYNNTIIELNSKLVVKNLDTLPSPMNYNVSDLDLPEIAFTSPGVYGHYEVSGAETTLDLIREMNNRYKIDDAVKTIIFKHDPMSSVQPGDAIAKIGEIIVSPFTSFVQMILTILGATVGCICFIAILYFLIKCCCLLKCKKQQSYHPVDNEENKSLEQNENIELR